VNNAYKSGSNASCTNNSSLVDKIHHIVWFHLKRLYFSCQLTMCAMHASWDLENLAASNRVKNLTYGKFSSSKVWIQFDI